MFERQRKKKEQEGKDVLKNHLSAMDSIGLCNILYKNGILADKLLTLDKDTLKEMGLTLGKRIRFLDKIQSYLAGIYVIRHCLKCLKSSIFLTMRIQYVF